MAKSMKDNRGMHGGGSPVPARRHKRHLPCEHRGRGVAVAAAATIAPNFLLGGDASAGE